MTALNARMPALGYDTLPCQLPDKQLQRTARRHRERAAAELRRYTP